MKVLVINCGSSSLKYQLIDMEGGNACCARACASASGIEAARYTQGNGGEWETGSALPHPHRSVMKVV